MRKNSSPKYHEFSLCNLLPHYNFKILTKAITTYKWLFLIWFDIKAIAVGNKYDDHMRIICMGSTGWGELIIELVINGAMGLKCSLHLNCLEYI